MKNDLPSTIESIRTLERGLDEASKAYRSHPAASNPVPPILESGFSIGCKPVEKIEGRVAAVDGGIVSQDYQSYKIVLNRAVSVVFEYASGKVVKNTYRPSKAEGHDLHVIESFDDAENAQSDSIMRLQSEISRAKEAVELFNPTLLFLDGSIFPNPSDKPQKESPLFSEYSALLDEYRALFAACKKNRTALCGIVKDSKSRIYLDALRRSSTYGEFFRVHPALLKTNDSAFLSMALDTDFRTPFLRIERQDLPQDLLSSNPVVSYIKAAKDDRPLRVEFFDASLAAQAACQVSALCKGNDRYAYPAILIEADLRAMMDPSELDVAYSRICSKLGYEPVSLRKLRRNERPFR